MEWRDEGIILGTRRHGETSVILEVMTRGHGRHLGLVRGGRSRKMQPVLQAGNGIEIVWRARLDEHLGSFAVEPVDLRAARYMENAASMYGLQLLAAHLRLLPERDPHGALYETMGIVLEHLDQPVLAAELIVRFELHILEELGFGLDLSECAATGARDELVYVSPKSGRAVSREAGEPWHDKLLALPSFLQGGSLMHGDETTLADAFRMTGFFLTRHIYEPRGMDEPDCRIGFLGSLRRSFQNRDHKTERMLHD